MAIIRIAALAAMVILAAGPAIAGHHEVTAEQAAQFRVGVATYDEVVAKLGRPTMISTNSDGERVISYDSVRARPKAISFVPIVGLFAGGATGQVSMATFSFGPDGVLTRSNTTDSNSDCSVHLFSVGCQGGAASAPTGATTAPQIASPAPPPRNQMVGAGPQPVPAPPTPAPAKKATHRPCLRVLTDPDQSSC